jgi:hypothetical protein
MTQSERDVCGMIDGKICSACADTTTANAGSLHELYACNSSDATKKPMQTLCHYDW